MGQKQNELDFSALVDAIHRVHQQCAAYAGKAVNVSLTVRNWIIGRHISEFELHGADRAVYGERLLEALSKELRKVQVSSSGFRQLYGYWHFTVLIQGFCGHCPQNSAIFYPPPQPNRESNEKCGSVREIGSRE